MQHRKGTSKIMRNGKDAFKVMYHQICIIHVQAYMNKCKNDYIKCNWPYCMHIYMENEQNLHF